MELKPGDELQITVSKVMKEPTKAQREHEEAVAETT